MLHGGHEVPLRKLIERWPRSIANCEAVASVVDRLYLYDNSVDDRPAQLVLRASSGKIVRQYEPAHSWMAPIIAALTPAQHHP